MTVEAVYWIALAGGVSFLLLSLILGDVFHFVDFLHFDLGDSFSLTPVLFTSLAAFGGGGLLAIHILGAGTGMSAMAGLVSSVAAGAGAAGLFILLRRQEAGEGFSVSQLIGASGRCTLAIPPGKEGRVAVLYEGMTRTFAATSSDEIKPGENILVVNVVGQMLTVSKFQ